jgi:hypothetical protein
MTVIEAFQALPVHAEQQVQQVPLVLAVQRVRPAMTAIRVLAVQRGLPVLLEHAEPQVLAVPQVP